MIYAVIIFVVGSSIQAGAVNIAMLFLGKPGGISMNSGTESSQDEPLLGLPLGC